MEADEAERIFDEFAGAYRDWWGPVIAPSAVGVLDDLAIPDGDAAPFDLLDLGSGTGVLALAALARWPSVRVAAIDPSRGMLEIAAGAARSRSSDQAARLRTIVGAADRLPLEDASMDAAVSSFAIQLVPNRSAALREVIRVLRPGGRFACVSWHVDDPPFEPDDVFADVLDELQVIRPSFDREVQPYTSARAAAAEFRRAGFRQVRGRDAWLEHPSTPESYLDLLEHWLDRELFAGLDAGTRQQLRARSLERMHRLRPSAFVLRQPLVRVVGTRPLTSAD
jgi:ubiquinone/menaquinone biosynthesis C-methylase UbiE